MKKIFLIGLMSIALITACIILIPSCSKNDITNPNGIHSKNSGFSKDLSESVLYSRDKKTGVIYKMVLKWRADDTVEVTRTKTDSINSKMSVYNWIDTTHTKIQTYKTDSLQVIAKEGQVIFSIPYNDSIEINKAPIAMVESYSCWCNEGGSGDGNEIVDCEIHTTSDSNGGSYLCCEETHCTSCELQHIAGGGGTPILNTSGFATFSAKGIIIKK